MLQFKLFFIPAQATKDSASDNTDIEDLDDDDEYDDDDNDNEIEINSGNTLRGKDKIIAEEIDGLNNRLDDSKFIEYQVFENV